MLTVFPTVEELALQAAQRIAGWMRRSRGAFHLALSGGSTPARLFSILAGAEYSRLAWRRLQVYWCDERCVPPDHAESNYGLAHRLLLRHLALPPENIHRIPGELPARKAAEEYTRELQRCAVPGLAWPRLDAVLLGLGEDGHTASLFPGAPEQTQPVIPVRIAYQGRPAERVSLTPLVFNQARRVIFLVSGESKAAALAGTLRGNRDPVRWPALRIAPRRGRVYWWVDAAAARDLGSSSVDLQTGQA